MKSKIFKFAFCSTVMLFAFQASRATAQTTYNLYQYWLMPTGLVGTFTDLDTSGHVVSTSGQHCFWNGTLWGKSVYLQGDPSMTKFDIYIDNGGTLQYYATYKGNFQTAGGSDPASYAFNAPAVWCNQSMQIGQTINTAIVSKLMPTNARQFQQQGSSTFRVTLNTHYNQYIIPENGLVFNDVVQFTFYSNANDPNSREQYWLANGYGYIRSIVSTGTRYINPNGFSQIGQRNTPGGTSSKIQYPTIPWYDPFQTITNFGGHSYVAYVPNGFFLTNNGVNGAVVGNDTNLPGWNQSSADCVITTDLQTPYAPQTGPWSVCLRGAGGNGGNGIPDSIITSSYTPVNPGTTYTISGYVYRTNPSDNVYIDTNDGNGANANFTDAQANSSSVGMWEYVTATTTVSSGTTGIKVRCVRDGANLGNAYFYGITLQRTGNN